MSLRGETLHASCPRRVRGGMGRCGFTLLEIMIVLAIMGMLLAVATAAIRDVRATALREDANKVLNAFRTAAGGAASQGVNYRVVFNLTEEEQTYSVEACTGDVRLLRTDEEETLDAEKIAELGERVKRAGEEIRQSGRTSDQIGVVLDAASPEKAVEAAAAIQGVRLGTSTCQPVGGGRVSLENGIKISEIHVQHLSEPVSEGKASVHFFAIGNAEKTVVVLSDDDGDVFNILIHGMTGRAEIVVDKFDPRDHLEYDATGDRVEERE